MSWRTRGFEDAAVAAVMNRHFVNVKVDREERPDLDQIYQIAHQMLAQRSGGWPLTMALSPDGTPFFGGTYFPKEPRYGAGFADLASASRSCGAKSARRSPRRTPKCKAFERTLPRRAGERLDAAPIGALSIRWRSTSTPSTAAGARSPPSDRPRALSAQGPDRNRAQDAGTCASKGSTISSVAVSAATASMRSG